MTDFDDHHIEMQRNRELDELEVEALLRGQVPPERPDLEPLARLVQAFRSEAAGPPPAPSPALASLLETGLSNGQGNGLSNGLSSGFSTALYPVPTVEYDVIQPAPRNRRRTRRPTWRRRSAILVAAASIATLAGVTGAAAAGVLPDPIQSAVADSVDTVTPFSIPRPSDPDGGSNGIGDQVREQARHHGQDGKDGDKKDKKEKQDKKDHLTPAGKPTAPGAKGNERGNGGATDPNGKHTEKPGKGTADRSDGPGTGPGSEPYRLTTTPPPGQP